MSIELCILFAILMFCILIGCILFDSSNNNNDMNIIKNIQNALNYLNNENMTADKKKLKGGEKNDLGETINIKDLKLSPITKYDKLKEDLNNIIQLNEGTLRQQLIEEFKENYKKNEIFDMNKLFDNKDNINNKYLNRKIIFSEQNFDDIKKRVDLVSKDKNIIKPYENMCIKEQKNQNQEISDNEKKRKEQEEEYNSLKLDLNTDNNLEPYNESEFEEYSLFDC